MTDLPDGWASAKLEELTTKVGSGATPKGGKSGYKESGTPLIRSMNVHFDGFRHDGLAFTDEEQAERLRNVIVEGGDVLLNITGASIGRVTTAPEDMSGGRVNQHVSILRPNEALEPQFLSWFLASPSQQALIDRIQVGATRQALTKSMILADQNAKEGCHKREQTRLWADILAWEHAKVNPDYVFCVGGKSSSAVKRLQRDHLLPRFPVVTIWHYSARGSHDQVRAKMIAEIRRALGRAKRW